MYANDYNGYTPSEYWKNPDNPIVGERNTWVEDLAPYIGIKNPYSVYGPVFKTATGYIVEKYTGPPMSVFRCPSADILQIDNQVQYNGAYPGLALNSNNGAGHSAYIMNARQGGEYARNGLGDENLQPGQIPSPGYCHLYCAHASEIYLAFDGQSISYTGGGSIANPMWAGINADVNNVVYPPQPASSGLVIDPAQNQGAAAFRHLGKGLSKTCNMLFNDGHVMPVPRRQMVNYFPTDVAYRKTYNSRPPWAPAAVNHW